MITLNDYCLRQFGEKLYKLSLSAGTSCPNRDGSIGVGGCVFCSAGGSGDFAEDGALSVDEQIDRAKARVAKKFRGSRYIAYFQSYTATYGQPQALEEKFMAAALREDIAAVSIATRPDCLDDDIMAVLERVSRVKPLWVELGLQTIHQETAEYIRRGYDLPVFDEAVEKLKAIGAHVIVHLILALPGESREMMLQSVDYVIKSGAHGIKLQLLHVLEGTDLAVDYRAGKFAVMEMEEYVELVRDCVRRIGDKLVIHRLTGDGPKRILIAPQWSGDKKRVINAINRAVKGL